MRCLITLQDDKLTLASRSTFKRESVCAELALKKNYNEGLGENYITIVFIPSPYLYHIFYISEV